MQIKSRWVGHKALILWLMLGVVARVGGQSISELAVRLSASAQTEPPRITLNWPKATGVIGYEVSRKSAEDQTWGEPFLLDGEADVYVDTEVSTGTAYEYHVVKKGLNYSSHGYIYVGVEKPLVESRGKVILIVESEIGLQLAPELAVLRQDLVGDGWSVIRHDVPRMTVEPGSQDFSLWPKRAAEIAHVKRLIQADYISDPDNVKAVFLFGHVPIPYSGLTAPDQHLDHRGAWPSDVYYADMGGTWTDSTVRVTTAADKRNWNEPGDGKFDQNQIPGRAAVAVGRVDMANLPLFQLPEVEMLRQYLYKNHNYRHQLIRVDSRALLQDNLGVLNREIPAVNLWSTLTPLVGANRITQGRWLTDLPREAHLWAYGSGGGTYTRAAGVVETPHFLVFDFRVVFALLFGSYFGDWDSLNNLLRASLAVSSHTLSAAWVGRPDWYLHHMALGETIGYSARLTQNNQGLYQESFKTNGIFVGVPSEALLTGVHIGLLGDPTLRQQPVSPPLNVAAVTNLFGGVDLTWNASEDPAVGYYVYRAPRPEGPYRRLENALIRELRYRDPAETSERYYMVRAVKLETSASGSYFNGSQGVFVEASLQPAVADPNTWAGRGSGTWTINDAEGMAGSNPGWDLVRVGQFLNITASATNRFTVRIVSFGSDSTRGAPANFDNNKEYVWPLVTAGSTVIGFDPAKIELLTHEFSGDLGGGTFKVGLSSDERTISLIFTPNHPPALTPVVFTRPWDTPLRIEIADLIQNYTSDADGDRRALVRVGTSPNGTAVTTRADHIIFAPSNNFPETIPYFVQDVRPYREGDAVRVTMGTITIQPNPLPLQFQAHPAIEIEWLGEPGKLYQVQSRENNEAEWTDEGAPFAGTGEKTSRFERAGSDVKFYRIILIEGTETTINN